MHGWRLARPEMGLAMEGVALVEAMEMAQQLAAQCQVLRVGQDRAAETAARHLLQLVHPHIAAGADVAAEAMAAAQQPGLAERAAVGEFGKVQLDALHLLHIDGMQIGIVGQAQHAGLGGHICAIVGLPFGQRGG
jgi:hypothetical protein